MTPKKPNSALRKIARVRLSNGMEVTAYIPGEVISFRSTLLCSCAAAESKDLPACAIHIVRGTLDTTGVADRKRARSKYGAKRGKVIRMLNGRDRRAQAMNAVAAFLSVFD